MDISDAFRRFYFRLGMAHGELALTHQNTLLDEIKDLKKMS